MRKSIEEIKVMAQARVKVIDTLADYLADRVEEKNSITHHFEEIGQEENQATDEDGFLLWKHQAYWYSAKTRECWETKCGDNFNEDDLIPYYRPINGYVDREYEELDEYDKVRYKTLELVIEVLEKAIEKL